MKDQIKTNITIVEDNELYTFLFREQLKDSLNFNLNVYYSAEEYLKNLDFEENIDVVILDYNLPGLNGYQTLKQIKKNSPQTEVIILSGQNDIQAAVDIMKAGAFDYIVKGKEASEKVIVSINQALNRQYIKKENISLKVQLARYKTYLVVLVISIITLLLLMLKI
jgi:two-component system, NtrC family, response regulator AtoC